MRILPVLVATAVTASMLAAGTHTFSFAWSNVDNSRLAYEPVVTVDANNRL